MSLMQRSDCDLLMQHEWPGDVINTGFWVARRSAGVDRMLEEMIDYTTHGDADDQAYFNDSQVGREDLRIDRMDFDEFMCGNRFYYRYLFRKPKCRLMHFNYSVGRGTKKDLMMGHGCWYLDEPLTARLIARLRHVGVALGLRVGIPVAGEDVGADVPTLWQQLRRSLRGVIGRLRALRGR